MGIEDRLNTFGSIMGGAQLSVPQHGNTPSKPSKATEAVTINLDSIVSGYNEIEHRLEAILARFGGNTVGEKDVDPGTANGGASLPTTFLHKLNSSTAQLGKSLRGISMLLDRFEELV